MLKKIFHVANSHNLLDIIAIELNFWKQTRLLLLVRQPYLGRCQMLLIIIYRNIKILFWLVILTLSLSIKSLMHSVRATSFITCFKSNSGTCIDLILTNKKHSFKNTSVIETGLSDFHRMIFTQMKLISEKLPLRAISFRDFKNFVKTKFDDDLLKALICNPQTSYDYG